MKRFTSIFSALCMIAVASAANAEKKNIVQTALDAGSFNTLATALKAADLVETLQGEGPFTVFAPTDAAFEKLPAGTVETLLKPESKSRLTAILTYHVVSGDVRAKQVVNLKDAQTVNGQRVEISTDDGVKINQANVIKTDIVCSNGVIHVIDQVLLPPEKSIGATEARRMIRQAVNQGVPLFNAGHAEACAKVYMSTMREMLVYGDQMPTEIVNRMRRDVSHAQHTDCAIKRAWTLRHGLDHVYHQMAELE